MPQWVYYHDEKELPLFLDRHIFYDVFFLRFVHWWQCEPVNFFSTSITVGEVFDSLRSLTFTQEPDYHLTKLTSQKGGA